MSPSQWQANDRKGKIVAKRDNTVPADFQENAVVDLSAVTTLIYESEPK
jgi:hypothetical protein